VQMHEYLVQVRLKRGMILSDVLRAHTERFGHGAAWLNLPVLSRIESGKVANPQFRTVVGVAHAYGVSLDELARFYLPPN